MDRPKKERIDKLMVDQGLAPSRDQAKRLLMAGLVYDQNNQRYDKAGAKIDEKTVLHLKGSGLPYVGRGALKLKKALDYFHLDLTGHNMLDIGASTGGFTDLALQEGASHVYALDVGRNQLAYKLRQDDRVTVMEQTNFRYSQPEDFQEGLVTFATIDVSFISLALILPPLQAILREGGDLVALIKPQFEAGPERVGKGGIIRKPSVHQEVLEEVLKMIIDLGYRVVDLTYSPIKGGEGNIEFLAHLQNGPVMTDTAWIATKAAEIVSQAHEALDKEIGK